MEDPTRDGSPQTQGNEPEPEHSGDGSTSPKASPNEVDALREQLMALEDRYKNAERKISQQGQELSQYRRSAPEQPAEPSDGWDWENPRRSIREEMVALEQRIEQRRQAEQMLRDFADEKGIPARDLQRLNDRLQQAAADPYEYLETLARLHTSENTQQAIQHATETARDTVQKNARAVTTETTQPQPSPPGKSFEEMSSEELEAHIIKTLGVAERY